VIKTETSYKFKKKKVSHPNVPDEGTIIGNGSWIVHETSPVCCSLPWKQLRKDLLMVQRVTIILRGLRTT
jgi:hypothetical protein